MSANTRYDDTAALARVAKRHAPEGADMSNAEGEPDIERDIRLCETSANCSHDLRSIQADDVCVQQAKARESRWVDIDVIAAARAEGARQERRGSQKVMTGMCAALAVSVILNFAQWVWKV